MANDAGQFLASWQQQVSSSDYDVYAVRVTAATGSVEGSPLAINTSGSGVDRYPAVAALSSSQYLLVWMEDGTKVSIRRVGNDGTLPGTPLVDLDRGSLPAVAWGGGQALAVWEDFETAGQRLIVGQRLSDSDSLLGGLIYISPYYTLREYVVFWRRQSGQSRRRT